MADKLKDMMAASRILNRIRIPARQEPFPMEFLWFQQQYYARDRRRVNHKMHRHTFYEVHFPFAGNVTYLLKDGREFTVQEGEYLLIPPEVEHRFIRNTADYGKYSLGFSVSDKDLAAHGLSLPSETICGVVSPEMKAAIAQAQSVALRGDSLAPLLLQDAVFLLSVLMATDRAHASQAAKNATREDARLARAKQFIADNCTRPLTIGEVAAFVHLSERHLTRLFEIEEGCTPLQYLRRERGVIARERLLSGNEPLSVIAEELGFSCEYNFIRFFKSVEGLTPAKFRRSAHINGE